MRTSSRSKQGASTTVLVLVLAFCVILPLAIFGFEMYRYLLIQHQLRSVTDAAALSGCAALASVPEGANQADRQQLAMQVAYTTFVQNSILQTAFNQSNVTVNYNPASPSYQAPAVHHAVMNIILLDQNGKQIQNAGDPASTMQIQSYYSDKPIFAYNFMDLGTKYTAAAFSNGGLPSLDIILCFDVSGSMDDQTNSILVRRYWNGTSVVRDRIAPTKGSDTIYNIFTPKVTGTSFNTFPPQNLSFSSYSAPSNNTPYIWSEAPNTYPAPTAIHGLRSDFSFSPTGTLTAEQGLPPGNTTNGLIDPKGAGATGWTDLVVDIPATVNGFSFPNLDTVVEAARGNMEDDASIKQANNGTIPALFPARKAGYFKCYWDYVIANSHPMAEARAAAYNFFNTMNISANSQFGFITFSDGIGTDPNSRWSVYKSNLDTNYTVDGTTSWNKQGFPLPHVVIDSSKTNSQSFTDAVTAVNGSSSQSPSYTDTALVALGSTDIATALNQAIKELQDGTKVRKTSKKAIILFTDGVPNLPTDESTGSALALAAGKAAGNLGIPVYCIGLSQVPKIQTQEDLLLDQNTGIVKQSGNGALYISVTKGSQLQQAFQTIARSLCVLQ